MDKNLIAAFKSKLIADARVAKSLGYNPTIYLSMLEGDTMVSARKLIHASKPSSGFTKLWELNRLDLSLEYNVAYNKDFVTLFTEEERKICREKLSEYNYPPQI